MKITYRASIFVNVSFDNNFTCKIAVPYDRLYEEVEEMMWNHRFDTADICDANTGELLMRIERGV